MELKLKPVVLNIAVAGERTNSQKLSALGHGAIFGHCPTMEWSWSHYLLSLRTVSIHRHLFPLQPYQAI